MTAKVLRVPANKVGRDFVVGDIHGCFDLVIEAMRAVEFDQKRDRIFSVGDLIDRGPHSARSAKFLSLPWTYAVLGNHEAICLEMHADGEPDPAVVEFMASRNGFGWWLDTPDDVRQEVLNAIRPLPYAIELETPRGLVGLIHADVPKGMAWNDFTAALEAEDPAVIETCIWGRDRLHSNDESGIDGIGRVFCGHTPLRRLTKLGNLYAIDTAAVYGVMDIERAGALTFVDVMTGTNLLTTIRPMVREKISVAEFDGVMRPFSPARG